MAGGEGAGRDGRLCGGGAACGRRSDHRTLSDELDRRRFWAAPCRLASVVRCLPTSGASLCACGTTLAACGSKPPCTRAVPSIAKCKRCSSAPPAAPRHSASECWTPPPRAPYRLSGGCWVASGLVHFSTPAPAGISRPTAWNNHRSPVNPPTLPFATSRSRLSACGLGRRTRCRGRRCAATAPAPRHDRGPGCVLRGLRAHAGPQRQMGNHSRLPTAPRCAHTGVEPSTQARDGNASEAAHKVHVLQEALAVRRPVS